MQDITTYAQKVADFLTLEYDFRQLTLDEISSGPGQELSVQLDELRTEVNSMTNSILLPEKIINQLT